MYIRSSYGGLSYCRPSTGHRSRNGLPLVLGASFLMLSKVFVDVPAQAHRGGSVFRGMVYKSAANAVMLQV